MGLVKGETVPDIPQKLLTVIDGHPFSAVMVAQTSATSGLLSLNDEAKLDAVVHELVNTLLPEFQLEPEDRQALDLLSLLRTPVKSSELADMVVEKSLGRLLAQAFLDYDGEQYYLHPIFSRYYRTKMGADRRFELHRDAAKIYLRKDRELMRIGRRDPAVVAELVHHMSLSGQFEKLPELKAFVYEEMYPAARLLYADRRYDRAFKLFALLSESRPNEPNVWAYLGRCAARQQQWTDCDSFFRKALKVASAIKQNTGWIYRDWGQIYARFKNFDKAKELFAEAKKEGGRDDLSLLASEAFVDWETGHRESAEPKFKFLLNNFEPRGYTIQTYAMLLDKAGESSKADELRKQLATIEDEMHIPSQYEPEIEDENEV